MSERATRRIWFFALWFLLPWPVVVFGDVLVPAVRYALLAGAALLIGVTEGAAGPVAGIVGLFVGWTLLTTALCWLLAWLLAKLLCLLPRGAVVGITIGVLGLLLVVALFFDPYQTRFGRSAMGGLWEILT